MSRLYPQWTRYAYEILQSGNLLRYLDYRVRRDGTPWQGGNSDVKTTVKSFSEGTCVRHRVQSNVLKMYDKAPNVLRVETLLTDIVHFKSYRTGIRADGTSPYLPLRKGVADLHRRAEISQKINERHVQALATVAETKSVADVTQGLTRARPGRVAAIVPSIRWPTRMCCCWSP